MTETTQPYSDAVLVKQAQKGNRRAFDELVNRHHKAIVNFIYRNTNDASRAEELGQKAFIRCHLNLKNYNNNYKFTTWLYTIADNLCKNELRDKNRRPKAVELTELTRIPGSGSGSPAQALAEKEMEDNVRRAIQSLPEEYKKAIIMSFYQGLLYTEIAKILKTNENTVKSWIFRGKQKLFEMLEGYMK